jgi:hypothetical protein
MFSLKFFFFFYLIFFLHIYEIYFILCTLKILCVFFFILIFVFFFKLLVKFSAIFLVVVWKSFACLHVQHFRMSDSESVLTDRLANKYTCKAVGVREGVERVTSIGSTYRVLTVAKLIRVASTKLSYDVQWQ